MDENAYARRPEIQQILQKYSCLGKYTQKVQKNGCRGRIMEKIDQHHGSHA